MFIIPAIDLLDGQCVRLKGGDPQYRKVYATDPEQVAVQWQRMGAQLLHVVNLNGAFGDARINERFVEKIICAVNIPVQLGGGIRTLADAAHWLQLGVDRIIFGTVALEQPDLVAQACIKFSAEKIIVGLDARDGKLAIRGWRDIVEQSPLAAAARLKKSGVQRIIYTDTGRDGFLRGPDYETAVALAQQTGLQIIVAGGFGKTAHLQKLANFHLPQIEGAIIGTALYENKMQLDKIIVRFQK